MTQRSTPHTHRVQVTSSRRGATTARRRPMATSLVEQTGVGELYLHGLMRAQLRLTLVVLALAAALLLGLPLLFALVPATRTVGLDGLSFPWLVLGLLVYPVLVGLAAWYVRRSGRLERRFADVVARER